MSPTAVLRTPPASTSYHRDRISLRPPGKEKNFRRENSPSPTASIRIQHAKSPSDRSSNDSPSQLSPSPLRQRVLFERGSSGQYDSDDDDEPSPSLNRLHSPFTSRCASPFLGAWASRGSLPLSTTQPIEDDEGLFLISKTTATPTRTPTHPTRSIANYDTLTTKTPGFTNVILTPPAPKKHAFAPLTPLQISRPRAAQTPAETDWHLGRQTDSLTKLSLGEEDGHIGRYKTKSRALNTSIKQQDSSPSPLSRRRGHKRSIDGIELPRAMGGIFETFVDTPVATTFHVLEPPSTAKLKPSTPAFAPPIQPSPGSFLSATSTEGPAPVKSRSSSPKLFSGPIAKKYRPRDSGVSGLGDDHETEEPSGPSITISQPDMGRHFMDSEDSGLVTPGLEPSPRSAWPRAAFAEGQQDEVDEFIFKTLAAGGAPPKDKKTMPGTPIKQNIYAHSRPWMSSSKVMPPPAMPLIGGGE